MDAVLVEMMDDGLAIVFAVHHDVALILDGQTNLHSLGRRCWELGGSDGAGVSQVRAQPGR